MQSEERELISGLFGRLQPFEAQPRDGEAEAMIKEAVARQPAAPYLLVQTVLVQEQALKAAQERIAELEAKAGAAAPAASGFLGGAPKISPWGAAQPAAAPAAPRPSVPSTRSPLQAAVAPQQGGGGGGFLRTAMATAAGVAGGALLFEGIRNLMGSNPFGPSASSQTASAAQPAPLLPQDGQQQASADDNPMPEDLRNEDYDTAAYDDGGGDMGGSDDDLA
jgi:hypothetical protein